MKTIRWISNKRHRQSWRNNQRSSRRQCKSAVVCHPNQSLLSRMWLIRWRRVLNFLVVWLRWFRLKGFRCLWRNCFRHKQQENETPTGHGNHLKEGNLSMQIDRETFTISFMGFCIKRVSLSTQSTCKCNAMRSFHAILSLLRPSITVKLFDLSIVLNFQSKIMSRDVLFIAGSFRRWYSQHSNLHFTVLQGEQTKKKDDYAVKSIPAGWNATHKRKKVSTRTSIM